MTHMSIPSSMTSKQQATIRKYLTSNESNLIRISVLGAGGNGRRSIVEYLTSGMALFWFDPTHDGEYKKMINIEDSANTLEFFMPRDFEAPAESSWTRRLVDGGDAFFFVYSVSSRSAFEALHKMHSKLFRPNKQGKPVWVLAAKTDLSQEYWKVPVEEGEAFSRSIGARFRCVSAMTGVGLEDEMAAEVVCDVILSKLPRPDEAPGGKLRQSIQSVWNKMNRFLHKGNEMICMKEH